MSKDYENADNFVINGGKNLSAAFLTLSLRVSGMLKQEQIRQEKKGFHSTKSIKSTFLNYLIVSGKHRRSTPSGSGGLFSSLNPPPEMASEVNKEYQRVLLRVASQNYDTLLNCSDFVIMCSFFCSQCFRC